MSGPEVGTGRWEGDGPFAILAQGFHFGSRSRSVPGPMWPPPPGPMRPPARPHVASRHFGPKAHRSRAPCGLPPGPMWPRPGASLTPGGTLGPPGPGPPAAVCGPFWALSWGLSGPFWALSWALSWGLSGPPPSVATFPPDEGGRLGFFEEWRRGRQKRPQRRTPSKINF